MTQMVTGDVLMVDFVIYWLMSMFLLAIMDVYAKKRLGGKRMLGYKVLKIPKFICMSTTSLLSIIGLILCMRGFEIKMSTATFLGLPYFVIWVYFLVTMLRRVRAEVHGHR